MTTKQNSTDKLSVVLLLVRDLTIFTDQMRIDDIHNQSILEIMVVGFLVREDDEYVCLAQQVFNEDNKSIRFTLMIPQNCIIERHEFRLNE